MSDAIDSFWGWWPRVRPRVEAAIGGKGFDRELITEINDRVNTIHDHLDWEFAPGQASTHAFCLSAKGDPEVRLVTELWRMRGPAPDPTWEFHGARQGGPIRSNLKLQIDGHDVSLAEFAVAFEVDPSRERVDGVYWHPAFAAMDERLRQTITFLTVDGVFGEDGVERWLGAIETSIELPERAQPIAELTAAVDQLARSATGTQYAILRGEDDAGNPVLVTVNQALKRIDHLLYCMHVAIDLAIVEQAEHGMPTAEDHQRLSAIEDELATALGKSAVFLGRETRRGRRVLHWFALEDGPAGATIERWSKAHVERDVSTVWRRDPTWEIQRRFT